MRAGLTAVMPDKTGNNRRPPPGRLDLRKEIDIHAPGQRAVVRTVEEALRMIDRELQQELRRMPRWAFARALLLEAGRTRKKRDLIAAERQLRQALSNEGWLAPPSKKTATDKKRNSQSRS